ncbi:uncharacterized protein LOC132043339 [Lycium ferocissimum]|uniref:uncharacterized protein LOC132043339 n=1 Tax=Lycium ferocissimum TaxID=112874 RepID=UPI002814B552|nr:uncharacterized protein LOC132043339 [Lycium ferocissimum]
MWRAWPQCKGCQKVAKGKQSNGGRKTKKRTRSLIDEDDEGLARSPPATGLTLEEELELTVPQPTQTSQASSSATALPSQASSSTSEYRFMPTPSVARQQPINNTFTAEPDFDFLSNDEADPPLMPMSISEAKTRFLRQMQVGEATGTRCIGFVGDASGVSKPTNLPFSLRELTWQGNIRIGNKLRKWPSVCLAVETCKWMSCYHFMVTVFGVIMWHPLWQCNCTFDSFWQFYVKLMLDSLYKMLAALFSDSVLFLLFW